MARQSKKNAVNRRAVFNRRMFLLAGCQLAAFGLVGAQLYRLQVSEGADLAERGREVITKRDFILPQRGAIADRAGRPLAFNQITRVVRLRIRDFPNPGATPDQLPKEDLSKFAQNFGLNEAQQTRVRLDIDFALGRIPAEFYLRSLAVLPGILQVQADFVELAERAFSAPNDHDNQAGQENQETAVRDDLRREIFVTVERGISATRRDLVRAQQANMPLIELADIFERRYEGAQSQASGAIASLSHVVGYTKRVFREDLLDDGDPLLRLPGARIGATGIERAYDRTLRGIAGARTWQITGGGRKLEKLSETAATKGEDLTLTIDLPLQRAAVGLLSQHQEAAAVVMNIHNGEILAMASQPAYNSNAFVPRISSAEFDAYLDNPFKPLFARASQGAYPPGSTFKMVGTLAALQAGFDSTTTFNCPGYLEVSGQRFRCWKRQGHGLVDMRGALRESCDVWFYEIAQRLGLEQMRGVAEKFGFGSDIIENFLEQSTALLPSRSWKASKRGAEWVIGDSVQFAIGQGFMLATPVQLAAMTASIANGGYRVYPHLVRANGFYDTKESLGFDAAHLQVVREGMSQVVNSDTGTARRSQIDLPWGPDGTLWRLAGKTGTAQVTALAPDESEELDEDIPYDQRDHALFVGFAPLEAPKFACAVVVEHGGSGSATAAPLASNLMTATLSRYRAGNLS